MVYVKFANVAAGRITEAGRPRIGYPRYKVTSSQSHLTLNTSLSLIFSVIIYQELC